MTTERSSHLVHRFDVWNEVPLVAQTSSMSCWAAAAAMIVGWRERRAVDGAAIASGTDMWGAFREGLRPSDVTELARVWDLELDTRRTWTVETLLELLERVGPVWVGEASPGLHSVVVTGIYGDGTAAGTFVRVNDPWPIYLGERYVRSWQEWLKGWHAASMLTGLPAQVLYARAPAAGRSHRWDVKESHTVEESRRDDAAHRVNISEEFHMKSATIAGHSAVDEYAFVQAGGAPAGERYIDTATWGDPNPLAPHGGRGENLLLRWNAIPDDAREIDVVVHLHGYSSREPDGALTRHKADHSGLDLTGRARPTLALLPRGRRISADEVRRRRQEYEECLANACHLTIEQVRQGGEALRQCPAVAKNRCRPPNASVYTFPGLLAQHGQGLEQLIGGALRWFAREVGRRTEPISLSRLILTAHSGGGAPLDALLADHTTRRTNNPEEVHVFDALYGNTNGLSAWLRQRVQSEPARGAMRIAFREGEPTATNSVAMERLARSLTNDAGYRALAVRIPHDDIPGACGPVLLRDVRADLPTNTPRVSRPQATSALSHEEDSPMYEDDGSFAATLSLDSDARSWLSADHTARQAFDASVASWVASTDSSGVELIADEAKRQRYLSRVDWSTKVFPGWNGDSAESRSLFADLTTAIPERRVPRMLRYRDVEREVVAVPGQNPHRLWPEAKDKFLEMEAAARRDGVTLRIASSFRSEQRQRELAARNKNPNAVAQGHSAHTYGLAIDFRLSVPGLEVAETSTRPMTNIVKMYRSPVYKWLALHAREFGFYPYRMEPWHFEYNPVGFRDRYEARTAATQSYGAPVGLFEAYRADPPDGADQPIEPATQDPQLVVAGAQGLNRVDPDAYVTEPDIVAGVHAWEDSR